MCQLSLFGEVALLPRKSVFLFIDRASRVKKPLPGQGRRLLCCYTDFLSKRTVSHLIVLVIFKFKYQRAGFKAGFKIIVETRALERTVDDET